MDVYTIISDAIRTKRNIRATYDGHTRDMSPHAIGTKEGEQHALFYQFAGGSTRGLPPGGAWRCIRVNGLSNVVTLDGPWHTGSSHSRPQTCIDAVDVEVAY